MSAELLLDDGPTNQNIDLNICSLQYDNSWHAKVLVNNQPFNFLVDSGAMTTLIDISIFEAIGGKEAQLAPLEESLVAVGGHDLSPLGTLEVDL